MSVHIMCLTSAGGLPVFLRKKGEGDSLTYSTIGSLNGVHMFSKSHNVDILHTSTENHNVVWKEFHDCMVLIAISSGSTVLVLNHLLECVFQAMVLIVGIDEIKSQRNIERLKRELKRSYPIIDKLLDGVDYNDSSTHISDIITMAETILCPENHLIQVFYGAILSSFVDLYSFESIHSKCYRFYLWKEICSELIVLNSYAECVDALYACVLIHGKIAVATESWWTLHSDERKLLSFLGSLEHDSTAKDYSVFLPHKSPHIAFRLVSCTLIPDVVVCCLLGATPPLDEVEQTACQCFKTTMEILRSAESVHPRNFPHNLQLDAGILGILLLNCPLGKYILSRNPQQTTSKRTRTGSHRLDILRTFYYQTVLTLFTTTNATIENKNIRTVTNETYWCSEYHKCHALKINENILCVLYASTVSTHAMKLITQATMKSLITDKQLCW